MATLTYTLVDRCGGGGHTKLDVSLNGGAAISTVYNTEEIRAALSELTPDDRKNAALLILKLHMAGKTRAQIAAEFQAGPVTVTL
jgi:hypothetical protein